MTEELTIITEMFKRQEQKAEKKARGINSPQTVKSAPTQFRSDCIFTSPCYDPSYFFIQVFQLNCFVLNRRFVFSGLVWGKRGRGLGRRFGETGPLVPS